MPSDAPPEHPPPRDIEIQWLGRRPFSEMLVAQRQRREAIVEGLAEEVVWLLEHEHVITTGIRPVPGLDPYRLGMPVVATERGGLATYHGPGQLVGYLLIDIGRRGCSVRKTICAVEAGLMTWLDGQGIEAKRRAGAPGVWVGENKIAALGMHFRRGVSMHGFALNLTVDLGRFSGFVPCGITEGGVTSVLQELGRSPAPIAAASAVGRSVLDALLEATDACERRRD